MITFEIPGPVRGKGRPRFARAGAFVRTYTDDKTESYEGVVKWTAKQAMGERDLLDGALEVCIQVTKQTPKSMSQKKRAAALAGRIRPTLKPDWDNIGKIVCDALNGVVYKDDSQIADGRVEKFYGERDGAIVIIQKIGEDD